MTTQSQDQTQNATPHPRYRSFMQLGLLLGTVFMCTLWVNPAQAQSGDYGSASHGTRSYRLQTQRQLSLQLDRDAEELAHIQSLGNTATGLYVSGGILTGIGVLSAAAYAGMASSSQSGIGGIVYGLIMWPLAILSIAGMVGGVVGLVLLLSGGICDAEAHRQEAALRRRRGNLDLSFDVAPIEGGAMASATLRF